MPSFEGLILDATALIDFCWLGEWEWLQKQYSPLFIAQEVLDSDRLESTTQRAASQYLKPLTLNTEEMFSSFMEFQVISPLLSEADRSTLALARYQFLLCISDDNQMIKICKEYNIRYIRMLRLLSQMVESEHKTCKEAIDMVDTLIKDRRKWIAKEVVEKWKCSLNMR